MVSNEKQLRTTIMGKHLQHDEPRCRAALRMARRVVIKAGTSVVANADGSPSLTRLGSIVEQIAELHAAGVQVIFVSSGAVGMGRNLLRKQARLNMSFMDLQQNPSMATVDEMSKERLTPATSITDLLEINDHMETSAAKSCAAAGQFELMNLYQSLFSPKGVTASQVRAPDPFTRRKLTIFSTGSSHTS